MRHCVERGDAPHGAARRGIQSPHQATLGMASHSGTRWPAAIISEGLTAIGVTLLLISGCGSATRDARVTHRVEIKAMRFEPAVIHVAVGDTVRWTNLDLVPHTATSREGTFDSGNLPPDAIWAVVVTRGGVHDYSCLYHPGMKGSITAGP